jgi:apolipoprotein N-acyltransferase
MRDYATKLKNYTERLQAWQRALLICGLGLFSGLSMPPVDAWWILGLAFPLFVLLLQNPIRQPLVRIFVYGWCFGFGYFLCALHWIGFAFLVDAKDYLWMMPFAVGGLAGGLAVFWGFATALAQKLVERGWPASLVFPVGFGVAEWLRGYVLTGFPWAVPGLAADGMGGVLQLASIIGMNGLTVFVLLWAMTLFGLAQPYKRLRWFSVLTLAILPLSWGWGVWRIALHPTQYLDGPVVRLVQPNISQDDKWRGSNARAIYDQLLELSSRPAVGLEPTVIVWPESAVPFLLDESLEGKKELQNILQERKILLTGAVRRSSPEPVGGVAPRYYTSVLAFDGNANVIGHYDKKHLVPGGEYLPLAWLLEPLGFRKVVNLPESFSVGTAPSILPVVGLGLVGVQICYEAIFPNTIASLEKRPDWILNVTNDGWFGKSSGPYQHVAQLRMRAVEEGIGVVRVANTGVSSVIDSTGSYVTTTALGVVAVLDSRIPKSLEPTVYSSWRNSGLIVLLGTLLVLAVVLRSPKVSSDKNEV